MEKSIMPEIELFPKISAVGRFVMRAVTFLPTQVETCLSEHIRQPEQTESQQ